MYQRVDCALLLLPGSNSNGEIEHTHYYIDLEEKSRFSHFISFLFVCKGDVM